MTLYKKGTRKIATGTLTYGHFLIDYLRSQINLYYGAHVHARDTWNIHWRYPSKHILRQAAEFIRRHGFRVNLSDSLVEYHEACSLGSPVETLMAPHTDDFGGCKFKTVTLIIYAGSYEGGELEFSAMMKCRGLKLKQLRCPVNIAT